MELLALLFVIWLIGCAFPGSSGGGQFEFMLIPVVIISVALIYGVLCAITYAAVGVAWMTGLPWTGIAAWPVIFVGVLFANKLTAEWFDRRKLRREHI